KDDGATLGSGVDLLHTCLLGQLLDGDDLEQVPHLVRQGAKAVDQFGGEAVYVFPSLDAGQPPVERHADIEVGDIALGDQHRGAQIDSGRPLVGDIGRGPFL